MTKLNEEQLENIIGGISADAFIKSYADTDGSLLISGMRQKKMPDGGIICSKRHKLIENANAESVSEAIASFKAQQMTTVIVGSKEFNIDELAKIFA